MVAQFTRVDWNATSKMKCVVPPRIGGTDLGRKFAFGLIREAAVRIDLRLNGS
jgi:hypothetical protein